MSVFVAEWFLYGFLGFLLEVLYARVLGRGDQGRKCLLFFPLCPVYGLGAAVILQLPGLVLAHPVAVFVAGGFVATAVEGAVGLFYWAVAGVRFWDYSQLPGNVFGLICPLYTVFWGLLALGLVYGLHPLLSPLLMRLSPALLLGLFWAFALDALASLWVLHRAGSKEALRWYR